MSAFEVLVEKVAKVEHHPNADRLSLVQIRDYRCICAKKEDGSHRYEEGDLVVYVPEASIVPEYLLRQGFWDEKKNQGILAGTHGNRVKAIKLRGELSQGIIFPAIPEPDPHTGNISHHVLYDDRNGWRTVEHGDDVTEFLGIVKYEPPIPTSMSGQVKSIGLEKVFKYDIENIKKYPGALDDRDVVYTEKLHGTLCVVGCIPYLNDPDFFLNGSVFVSSKGMFAKGLVLQNTEKNLAENLYVQVAIREQLMQKVAKISQDFDNSPVFLFGEIFGAGVQDLHYGETKPTFRLFDIYVNYNGESLPMDYDIMRATAFGQSIETVPELGRGRFDRKTADDLTNGLTWFNGHNIREGIVIKPVREEPMNSVMKGRLILKSVSEDYLLRKGGTEFN